MTQKLLGKKEVCPFLDAVPATEKEGRKAPERNELSVRFINQHVSNLRVKDAMARELAADDLPDVVIRRILHLEDEPPF